MPREKKQKEILGNLSKDNDYFLNIKSMLASSVGRLPTALVVVLLISLAMATIGGVILEFNKPPKSSKEFMPLRLEASQNSVSPDLRAIQKIWIYQTPDYAMTFTIIGDRFEWIVSFSDIVGAQFYARGNYRLVGDVMILGVRNDLGIPYDSSTPWLKYMPIAMRNINIYIGLQDKSLLWTVPESEQKKILSHSSLIFADNKDGHFKWMAQ